MIRPELAEQIKRWREPIGWGVLSAFCGWLAWRGLSLPSPLLMFIGVAVGLPSLTLLRAAIRRVKLTPLDPGEGIVTVDEGRIGYFGPIGGGFVDLSSLEQVVVVSADGEQADHWILRSGDGTHLAVPVGASGAERLPDVLGALPGINFEMALSAMQTPGRHREVIWKKEHNR